ncbi:MAG: hypothetical protein LBB36_02875, partial [Fibromonadaceae bacterium]|jgi:hypothetical protein|nr:hypothetical protein [Fibromonadaceae bacterium]
VNVIAANTAVSRKRLDVFIMNSFLRGEKNNPVNPDNPENPGSDNKRKFLNLGLTGGGRNITRARTYVTRRSQI